MNISQQDIRTIINFVRQHPNYNIKITIIPSPLESTIENGNRLFLGYEHEFSATKFLKTEVYFE